MVTFRTEGQAPTVDEARSALEPNFETGISLERLEVTDPDGTAAILYRLRTTDTNEEHVSAQVAKSFEGSKYELIRQSAEFGEVETGESGSSTSVTVSSPMTPGLLENYIADGLKAADETRYAEAEDLVSVEATGDESDDAKATTFSISTTPDVDGADLTKAFATVNEEFGASPFFDEVNSFDSAVAGETQQYAIVAMLVSLVAIVAYIWIRFQSITFGLAAVAALVHDVLVVLGMVAIAGFLSGDAGRSNAAAL